jgi:hypothetical protein
VPDFSAPLSGKQRGMFVKRTVRVWGTSQEIDVHRRSAALWVATGEYMGQWIEARGSTEPEAVKNWRETARRGKPEAAGDPQ